MKRNLRLLLYLVAAGSLVFVLGPRPSMDYTLRAPALPQEGAGAALDAYLAETEAARANIRPNTEKTIVWADSAKERTPLALVYLHGFSATRQETAPLADTVAQHFGANLFYTRLTGHGRDGAAMAEGTVDAWLNDVLEAYHLGQRLGERVVFLGTSTGGTLATWWAAHHPGDLAALVLISPNFGPRDGSAEVLLWPWAEHFVPLLIGDTRTWEPRNEAHAAYWTYAYPIDALFPMMALVEMTQHADLQQIHTPTLAIYDPADTVIDTDRAAALLARFGRDPEVFRYASDAPDHHVLAGDALAPTGTPVLADRIIAFLEREIEGRRGAGEAENRGF